MKIDQIVMTSDALDRLDSIALLMGLDGSILDANPTALDCYGHSRDEIVTLSIHDLRAPGVQDDIDEQMRKAIEHGVLYETVHHRGDGSLFPVEVRSTPVLIDGEPALLSLVRDLTAHRQAEQELEESESRYRALAESSPLGVFVSRNELDDDRVVLVNPACVKLFGASSPEKLFGTSALELFESDSRALVRERIEKVSEAVVLFEARILRLDGTPLDVEVTTSPLLDQGVAAIQVVLHDITERKREEKELRQSQEKFAAAFNASPNVMIITRLDDGKIMEVNEGFVTLSGYTRAESLGKTTAELSIWIDPAGRAEFIRLLAKTGEVKEFEATFQRKDRVVIPTLMSARVVEIDGQECILSVVHDITERKRAEEVIRRSEAELQEAQRIGHFGSFDWDARTDTIMWSDEYYRIYGLDPSQEPPGYEEHLRIYSPESAARLDAAVKRSMQTGEPYGLYLEQACKDGTQKWIHVRGEVKRGPDNTIIGMRGTAQDITERIQAEQEQLRAQEFFRDTFEHADVGIAHVNSTDGAWLRVNQRLCDLLGYTREELLHTTFAAITHPDDVDKDLTHLGGLLAGDDETYDAEKRYIRKDGSILWARLNVAVIRKEDGTPDYNIAVLTDISERKHVEEEVVRQKDRINRTLSSVIDIACNIVEMRDPYTAGHQRRVSELAVRISEEMSMTPQNTEEIRVASLIHDVGKMSVPAEILSKPGALSSAEFALIQGHAETGYRIITSANMQVPIAEMVYQHHERCNGTGYPRGLSAKELLPGAKVLMVADVVEAMTSHRPYRPALGVDTALQEIERGAGTLYDAEVCKTCITLFRAQEFAFSEA